MTDPPLEIRWQQRQNIPRIALRSHYPYPQDCKGFDYTQAMRKLIVDITCKVPSLYHIKCDKIAIGLVSARVSSKHGLLSRVTALRNPDGQLDSSIDGQHYRYQRLIVDDVEMLYVLELLIPRFLDLPPSEKLVTTIHELYHMSPSFDGSIRRFEGRNRKHTSSKAMYQNHILELVQEYFINNADMTCLDFLNHSFDDLCRDHGFVVGWKVPRIRQVHLPGR